MRRIFLALVAFLPLLVSAQFAPPGPNSGQSGVAFWAAGKTSWLAGTTSSAVVFLSVTTNTQLPQIQVFNSGTTLAFVECGPSTVVATVGTAGASGTSYPVAPGSVIVMTPSFGTSTCAGIYGTGSGAIYFTPGAGL